MNKKNKKKYTIYFFVILAFALLLYFGGVFTKGFADNCPSGTCKVFDYKGYQWRVDVTPGFAGNYQTCGYAGSGYFTRQSLSFSSSSSISFLSTNENYKCPGTFQITYKMQTGNVSLYNYSTFIIDANVRIRSETLNPGDGSAVYIIGLKDRDGVNKIAFLSQSVGYPTNTKNVYGFTLSKSTSNPSRWTISDDAGNTATYDISSLVNPQVYFEVSTGALGSSSDYTVSAFGDVSIVDITPPIAPVPAGCLYHNPDCGAGYHCQDNTCVPNSPSGCQYHNPDCSSGLACVNNSCVVDCSPAQYNKKCYSGDIYWYDKCDVRNVLFLDCPSSTPCTYDNGGGAYCSEEDPVGCAYNNPACTNGYHCENNQCVIDVINEGCTYNNPACTAGFHCVNNNCIVDEVVKDYTVYYVVGIIVVIILVGFMIMRVWRHKK